MKYIRTKEGRIIKCGEPTDDGYDKGTMEIQNKPQIVLTLSPFEVLKESHSIKELCDEFVAERKSDKEKLHLYHHDWKEIVEMCWKEETEINLYGAIWTDKGLIYIAKMKGVLPNGEIDWELL